MSAPAVRESTFRWLAAAIMVAALPHFANLPLWINALIPAAVLLRLGLGRPPGRWLLIPLVVAVFIGVVAQFRAISGPDAGGAFFAAMVALKFLESRSHRDAGLLVCLAYFHATAIFLYSEAIGMAVYVVASILLTTVALITLADPDGPQPKARLRVAGTLTLQALPIMIVLFVLFPRIPGPLWSLHDEPAATSGLSDSMSPGQVADLAMSAEVAFRVEFGERMPADHQLYWRGPIFTAYDGDTWSEGDHGNGETAELAQTDNRLDYTLTLEAHEQRWLFALDMPGDEIPADAEFNAGRQLLTRDPVRSTARYQVSSYLDYQLEPELSSRAREHALELPDDASPRTRELAADLRTEAGSDDAQYVQRALDWFRDGDFTYTLQPQRLTGDVPDEFLFDTRAGFCEHFASAFAILMRAADVPARVVTGYLGAESGGGNYHIVRQSDAHAWVEVWLADEGWVRVDPTATVAPDRIEFGLGSIPGTADLLPDMARRGDNSLRRRAALAWDGINHRWNRFVLGYGPDLQDRLLDRLGLEEIGRYALGVLSIAITGLFVAALWFMGRAPRPPRDRIERYWQRVERRLRRIGFPRAPSEGIHAYTRRVARARPDLAADLEELAELHDELRYQPAPSGTALTRFAQATHRFRVQGHRRTAASVGRPRPV